METEANVTGDCFPIFLDDTKCEAILGVRRVVAVISMLCSLFVMFIIVLFKKYKFLSQRLILYLSISAFFQSLVYATVGFHVAGRARQGINEGFCVFQGYWTLFFDWTAFIWVLCISFNVFWSSVFLQKTDKFEKFYIIISFALPITICCFPFIGNSYGPAGLWCWISSVRDGEVYVTGAVLQFVLFYVPLWSLSIVMLITLIVVSIILHHRIKRLKFGSDSSTETLQELWKEEIRPLLLFPLIYIAILVFPSMNRLRLAGGHNDPDSPANFFFWFMHAVTLTLHGTVYALVFACDKRTISRLRWREMKSAVSYWHQKPAKEYEVAENTNRETVYRKKHTIEEK